MTPRCFRCAALAMLLAALAAGATTIARMTLNELVAAAEVVARAQCLGSESRWEGGEIWTLTSFELTETLKGVAPRLVTVRLLGGRAGHVISTVDGVPRFREGEEAILFLERTPAGDFSVTGWVQGTFRIRRDAQTGEESVTQDSSRFGVFDPATRRFQVSGIRQLPLEVFKQRVADALTRQSNGSHP